MDGFLEPNPAHERGSHLVPIVAGVALVVLVVVGVIWLTRGEHKPPAGPPAYAANIKLSGLKTSAAENFVGATVSYLDGTVTNAGDKTVTHVVVTVTFKDDLGQVAQQENLPLHVLQTGGPYPDVVDLSASPLAPGQGKAFRLTFESISAQWNHAMPDLQISDVRVK